ncbi:MAG: hypothetical protein ABWY54_04775, partial [Glaciihabitans sp.]
DIEGESLRHHRSAVDWAKTVHPDAITADELVVGTATGRVGPLSFSVATGSLVLVSGQAHDRAALAATLAGRLDPVSGRAQVAGSPLPSDANKVARLAALSDISGTERGEDTSSIGELLEERVRLTQPWYRGLSAGVRARDWLERVNSTLADTALSSTARVAVRADDRVDELPQLERAVVLAAVALAEGTPIVLLDQRDAFAEEEDESAFLLALDRLAATTTTLLLGTPVPPRAFGQAATLRPQHTIDLYSFDRKGALL